MSKIIVLILVIGSVFTLEPEKAKFKDKTLWVHLLSRAVNFTAEYEVISDGIEAKVNKLVADSTQAIKEWLHAHPLITKLKAEMQNQVVNNPNSRCTALFDEQVSRLAHEIYKFKYELMGEGVLKLSQTIRAELESSKFNFEKRLMETLYSCMVKGEPLCNDLETWTMNFDHDHQILSSNVQYFYRHYKELFKVTTWEGVQFRKDIEDKIVIPVDRCFNNSTK